MRIPGLKEILYCPIALFPADLELQVMAGAEVNLAYMVFTALPVLAGASLVLSDSNENYGSNRHAELRFSTTACFAEKQCAFLVTTVSGAVYLIGNGSSVPSISITENWDSPADVNRREVYAELTGPLAWACVESNMPEVETDTVRDITQEEIDAIIGKLK